MKSINTLLMLLLLVSVTAVGAFAQVPLVYDLENTGASFPAPHFLDKAHLPIIRPLPDPFVFFSDGTRDTRFTSWEQRRNEIKSAMEQFELGPKPDCSDCTITATWVPSATPGAPTNNRGTLTINVTRNGVLATIVTRCYVPVGVTADNPIPAIMPMVSSAGASNLGTGSLGATPFAGLTIGSCDFPHNAITTYGGPKLTDNFYKLYPNLCAGTANCTAANGYPNGSNSGQYAAWSWGISRVIDGIIIANHQATDPLPIDSHKLLVTGCSYAGKMAMYGGAFDERVAFTVAQENGGGGAPSWRANTQTEADDMVENLDHTDHNWFASFMWNYQGNDVYKLPHDHHELQAMVAPRAMLETGNTDFLWLSNQANTISSRATQKIYETFGIGDRYGFYIDGGHGHCSLPAAQAPVIAAWTKKYLFGDTTQNTDTHVTPYSKIDTDRWSAWWGTTNPVFPNDWNPGNGQVVLSLPTALTLNNGDTLNAGYDVMKPGSHQAATVTLNGDAYADASVQADVSCPDNTSYTLTVPFAKQAYSIPADDNSWYPSGADQASLANSTASACNGVVTNAVFSAKGTQTTRGAGNSAGPGFTDTDTNPSNPLNVQFHVNVNGGPENVSQTTTIAHPTAQIMVTAVLTKNQTNGIFTAALTIKNNGTGTVQTVKLTAATLGGVNTTTNLPTPGDLLPNSFKSLSLAFPATTGNSGNGSVLKVVGTYVGGSFATSLRVVLP